MYQKNVVGRHHSLHCHLSSDHLIGALLGQNHRV